MAGTSPSSSRRSTTTSRSARVEEERGCTPRRRCNVVRVVRIDPAGFTKVSALGIEEQRVRTIIDFVDPPETWSQLGHDFRVTVHVTVWSANDAVTVPVSALFRKGDDWAVFSIVNGRARTTPVRIGYRNNRVAEVTEGATPGDRVILHPSDRTAEGVTVMEREGP